MSSRNYRRGYDAEKLLCTILEGAGRNMWVERFHASKGTFDLMLQRGKTVQRATQWVVVQTIGEDQGHTDGGEAE